VKILGLKEDEGENPEEKFVQLFEKNLDEVLQTEEIEINRIIGQKIKFNVINLITTCKAPLDSNGNGTIYK